MVKPPYIDPYLFETPLWGKIPIQHKRHLRAYIENGEALANFLRAVVSNNLCDAVLWSGEHGGSLKEFMLFLYNEAPSGCWGSDEKYDEWIARGGMQGAQVDKS